MDVVYNNTDTSEIHYSGEWDLQTIHFAPSVTLTAPLHRASAHGASARLNLKEKLWLYMDSESGEAGCIT